MRIGVFNCDSVINAMVHSSYQNNSNLSLSRHISFSKQVLNENEYILEYMRMQ